MREWAGGSGGAGREGGEKRLVGYVVWKEEEKEEGEREWKRERVGDGRATGVSEREVAGVHGAGRCRLEEMPLTANGKVDRKKLPEVGGSAETAQYIAPRTQVEEVLCEICAELLGLRRVGVSDNFFKLGGHSLLAVRLMARIEKVWRKTLPLTALFQSKTIEDLAGLIGHETSTPTWSSLVRLKGGVKPPFFCIHPVGGNILCYAGLAYTFDLERPFYGLQAQGLNQGQVPQTKLEVMASHYLNEIRSVQASGPYFLGGWSVGGLLAFEVAQQLRAQGEKIALLAMFDTRTPDQMGFAQTDDARLLRSFAIDLGLPFERLAGSLQDHSRLDIDGSLGLILQAATTAGILPQEISLDFMRRHFEVFAANVRAARNYKPRSYQDRITLFAAQDNRGEPRAGDFDPTYGWRELSPEVEVFAIPGDHYTIMREPNMGMLANELNRQLSQAEADPTTTIPLM